MKFKDATITPRYAQQLLARNDGNRKIRLTTVNKYAAMMLAGRWVENGDVIRVGKTGRLLDGQHRLHAVIESGVSIRCGLVLDVDETTFSTIDTGATRSTQEIVRMTGRINVAASAAVASLLWRMIQGASGGTPLPAAYVCTILDRWPEIEDAAHRAMSATTAYRLATPATIGAALLYLNTIAGKPAMAERFITGLNTGEGLTKGDPVFSLRQRLINMRAGAARHSTRNLWGAVVRVIDAMEAGESLSAVQIVNEGNSVAVPKLFFDHLTDETADRMLTDIPAYARESGRYKFDKLAAE